MKDKVLDTKQWRMFRRLEAAGCPLDLEHLPLPWYPLEVRTVPSDLPTNIFPMVGSTGIALPLAILVRQPFVIRNFTLAVDWILQPVYWIPSCAQHEAYCFHQCVYGDRKFDRALNDYAYVRWLLKRGMELRGCLLGTFSGSLPETAPAKLEATLWIRELSGKEYPFAVSVDNTKLPPQPAGNSSEGRLVPNGASQEKPTSRAAAGASKPSVMIQAIDRIIAKSDAELRAKQTKDSHSHASRRGREATAIGATAEDEK